MTKSKVAQIIEDFNKKVLEAYQAAAIQDDEPEYDPLDWIESVAIPEEAK